MTKHFNYPSSDFYEDIAYERSVLEGPVSSAGVADLIDIIGGQVDQVVSGMIETHQAAITIAAYASFIHDITFAKEADVDDHLLRLE